MGSIDETKEVWKVWKDSTVTPYGNHLCSRRILWEVSNMGRARRNGIIQNGCFSNGYIYIGGRSLHRIVATLFIPQEEGKTHVDHINGNRADNRVENLRWCTRKENLNFPIAHERMSIARKGKYMGEENPNFGKHWSEERRKEASERQRKTHNDPKVRERMSNSRKGSFRVYDADGNFHYEH